jgi:hypothetical protein
LSLRDLRLLQQYLPEPEVSQPLLDHPIGECEQVRRHRAGDFVSNAKTIATMANYRHSSSYFPPLLMEFSPTRQSSDRQFRRSGVILQVNEKPAATEGALPINGNSRQNLGNLECSGVGSFEW